MARRQNTHGAGDPWHPWTGRQGNNRLLLGLKGSLNEYELDLLRQSSLSPVRRKRAAANF